MKNQLFTILFVAALFLISCTKDAEENLPGTWSTSDGGTITFNEDGTGTTMNSSFFEFDCGNLNGNYLGPITAFEWMITSDGDNLFIAYDDQTSFAAPCSGTMEAPIKMKSKNKAIVGTSIGGFGYEVELTR